ncbi:MAG: hypothetical protein AB1567_12085 [bacterium]
MKLLRNFHLTKVKQNFFLFPRLGAFYGPKKKKIYNKRNNEVIILKSASSGVKRGEEGGEKEGYFDKFGRELRIR